MRKSLYLAFGCCLVLGLFFAAAAPADASCTGMCERNPNGGLFCRVCVDAGYETGVLCQQSGPCGCFFIQCAFSLQSSADSFATVDDAEAAGLFLEPAAQTPKVEGSCTPEEILFGLPIDG